MRRRLSACVIAAVVAATLAPSARASAQTPAAPTVHPARTAGSVGVAHHRGVKALSSLTPTCTPAVKGKFTCLGPVPAGEAASHRAASRKTPALGAQAVPNSIIPWPDWCQRDE